jgi:hypothetical protein
MEITERPFLDLPAALVDEVLKRAEGLGQKMLQDLTQAQKRRQEWRQGLSYFGLLRREGELPYMPIPTTCGVDGSYAIERLLTSDMVATAAVAVEGLTPPSETRYWPEPRHLVWVEIEPHQAEIGTILRGLMIGMELELAAQAPHEVVFIDGSLTTPLIYFNQALNKSKNLPARTTEHFLKRVPDFLEAYVTILASPRTDRIWLAVPKYTTRREIGKELGWPETFDDRALLSFLLEPGEFTPPRTIEPPSEPWHLNLSPLAPEVQEKCEHLRTKILHLLGEIQVIYYRPYTWLPALRLEMSRAIVENSARLATAFQAVKHQCGAPTVLEPYPLYMADRMVKHLPRAIPAFRQVTSQYVAEHYQGDIKEVFLSLHGYRTESGGEV